MTTRCQLIDKIVNELVSKADSGRVSVQEIKKCISKLGRTSATDRFNNNLYTEVKNKLKGRVEIYIA